MLEGKVLADRYRLLSQLGQGGMGSVWRAEHVALRTPAAVKLIDPAIAETPEALARFEREAQSAAALRSAHVVQILDYGVDAGTPYIAMELLVGESLAERLERVGRLPAQTMAEILAQVAKAMMRAHELGIVHRDLKPDNIFLTREGDEEIAKVLDFGIAKARTTELSGVATQTGSVLGTPYYMSPEQTSGKRAVDHRTDIWAFAVIAFECLTGARPFEGDTLAGVAIAICYEPIPTPSRFAPVPAGFDAWFERAAHRDPDLRFQTMKEAASALVAVCGGRIVGLATPAGAMPTPFTAAALGWAGTDAATPAVTPLGSGPSPTATPWGITRTSAAPAPQTSGGFSGTAPGIERRRGTSAVVLASALLVLVAAVSATTAWLVSGRRPPVAPVDAATHSAASDARSVTTSRASAAPLVEPTVVPPPPTDEDEPSAEEPAPTPPPRVVRSPRPRRPARSLTTPTPPRSGAPSRPSSSSAPPPSDQESLDDLVAL